MYAHLLVFSFLLSDGPAMSASYYLGQVLVNIHAEYLLTMLLVDTEAVSTRQTAALTTTISFTFS